MDTGVGGHSTAVGSGSGGGTVFLAAAAAERYKAPWGAGKGRYRKIPVVEASAFLRSRMLQGRRRKAADRNGMADASYRNPYYFRVE